MPYKHNADCRHSHRKDEIQGNELAGVRGRSASAPGPAAYRCEIDEPDGAARLSGENPHQIGVVHWVEGMILERTFVQRLSADEEMAEIDGTSRFREGGVTSTKPPPAAALRASVTGPILPASVKSKVEQTL